MSSDVILLALCKYASSIQVFIALVLHCSLIINQHSGFYANLHLVLMLF